MICSYLVLALKWNGDIPNNTRDFFHLFPQSKNVSLWTKTFLSIPLQAILFACQSRWLLCVLPKTITGSRLSILMHIWAGFFISCVSQLNLNVMWTLLNFIYLAETADTNVSSYNIGWADICINGFWYNSGFQLGTVGCVVSLLSSRGRGFDSRWGHLNAARTRSNLVVSVMIFIVQ